MRTTNGHLRHSSISKTRRHRHNLLFHCDSPIDSAAKSDQMGFLLKEREEFFWQFKILPHARQHYRYAYGVSKNQRQHWSCKITCKLLRTFSGYFVAVFAMRSKHLKVLFITRFVNYVINITNVSKTTAEHCVLVADKNAKQYIQ